MALPIKSPLNSLGLTSAPGSLQAFYNKIGSNYSLQKDNFVNYINAPKFFDVSIKNIKPPLPVPADNTNNATDNRSLMDKALDSLSENIDNALTALKNNFIDTQEKDSFFKAITEECKKIPGCSIITAISNYIGVDLNKDFKYYVQNITLPNIKIDTEYISNFTTSEPICKDGSWVVPENNNITIKLLDMAAPLHEYIFYPWMAEAGLSQWVYPSIPFTKADICISFMFPNYTSAEADAEAGAIESTINSGLNSLGETLGLGNLGDDPLASPSFQYIFKNCYPTRMDLISPDQNISNEFTRAIDFTFSHLVIKTSGITTVTATRKMLNALSNRVVNPVLNKGLQPITGNSFIPATSL